MANLRNTNDTFHNPNDQDDRRSSSSCCGASVFEIRVKGHLSSEWSDWLEGMEVELLENGEMILTGYIEDQAALMGVLNKLYRLNLTILSVIEVDHKK